MLVSQCALVTHLFSFLLFRGAGVLSGLQPSHGKLSASSAHKASQG